MALLRADRHATHLEVFALNNLFTAVLLQCTVMFARASCRLLGTIQTKWMSLGARAGSADSVRLVADAAHTWPDEAAALTGAFACGLALSNQHTIVLFVLPAAAAVCVRLWWIRVAASKVLRRSASVLSHCWRGTTAAVRSLVLCGVVFFAGLAPYAYVLATAHATARTAPLAGSPPRELGTDTWWFRTPCGKSPVRGVTVLRSWALGAISCAATTARSGCTPATRLVKSAHAHASQSACG